jgi:hypothetical protein
MSISMSATESKSVVLQIPANGPASSVSEEFSLNLLKSRDLPADAIESFCCDQRALLGKSRKLRRVIVEHPHTPRHLSLPMLRQLFTFDLMQVALAPAVASDLRIAAEEQLIHRLETISAGEKTTLARRASSRVAGALLLDGDIRVMRTALENGRVTEGILVKAMMAASCEVTLIEAVCSHPKWQLRREVRIALLLNAKTPAAHAVRIAKALPPQVARQTLNDSHLPEAIKLHIRQEIG